MIDLLCKFAQRFPHLAAEILYRDQKKSRKFREETITDILMAGLTAFEPLGIRVDFPADESKTGEDMDWEFVDPQAPDRRRYLRLHIQAKRAIKSNGKKNPYWFYRELDHAVRKDADRGSQHEALIDSARTIRGCVPLYMFYHPRNALASETVKVPAIEGVNLMLADHIPKNTTKKHWPVSDKKVEKWRQHFMNLSNILCFGRGLIFPINFPMTPIAFFVPDGSGLVSPGELADRLNELRREDENSDSIAIEAVEEIPFDTMRILESGSRGTGIAEIERPRAIFLIRRDE